MRATAWSAGLIVTVALLVSGPVVPAPEDSRTIRLVTGNDYAPYTDEKLPEGGLANEIVKRVYERLGVPYRIEWRPWKRGFKDGVEGLYDATYPYVFNGERDAVYIFSSPIVVAKLNLFRLARPGTEFAGLDDVSNMRVCMPLGWAAGSELRMLFESGTLVREDAPDMATCFKLLARARTDLALANEIQGWKSLRAAGIDEADRVESITIETNPLHVIFSRNVAGVADLVQQFNAGLETLRSSGEYDEIVRRHLER